MSVSSRLARWLVRLEELDPSKIELGLERTRLVYERLEIPPPALTILVAGTNGKGSVSHFLSCLLSQQSRRVGLYTSPHLHRFNERIAIEGEPVSDRLLVEAFDRIEAVRGQTPLTYFEFTTLAALVCFEHASVDCRVMEIGLGGRLDAVNVLEPDAAVLTNVGLDHQQWLGSSREQIGFEKAHVFRAGTPAVLGSASMPASVHEHIARIKAQPIVASEKLDRSASGGWSWQGGHGAVFDLPTQMVRHQRENLAAALAALESVDVLPDQQRAVVRCATDGLPPARQQREQINGRQWILDVAHNLDSASALAELLASLDTKVTLIFGAMQDKAIQEMTAALAPYVKRWIAVSVGQSRAKPSLTLARLIAKATGNAALDGGSPASGVRLAEQLTHTDETVVVAGSFPVVAAAKTAL